MKIEALHEFHDENFAKEWSNKFVPTEERISLFQLILDNITEGKKRTSIVELGIGPGYLAAYILNRRKNIIYEGLDFSKPMLKIAAERLAANDNKTFFTEVDLTSLTWKHKVKTSPEAIISTWALHDLLSKENIAKVYKTAYDLLPQNGKLINGDFIKPETSIIAYEAGRIKPSEHIELLQECGFREVECLRIFEEDIAQPTTANNYACFLAIK